MRLGKEYAKSASPGTLDGVSGEALFVLWPVAAPRSGTGARRNGEVTQTNGEVSRRFD